MILDTQNAYREYRSLGYTHSLAIQLVKEDLENRKRVAKAIKDKKRGAGTTNSTRIPRKQS